MSSVRSRRVQCCLTITLLVYSIQGLKASVIFVDADATGSNDGTTWLNAFNDLQDALLIATEGDQIWVSEGIYRPAPSNGDRTISFELHDSLSIYGGFLGTEDSLDERDSRANLTTLSGDLNSDDGPDNSNMEDNAHHVVTSDGVSTSAILDGFTISDGNADGIFPANVGGGIYLLNASPTLVCLRIVANSALSGAGIYNDGGDPAVIDSQIEENIGYGFSNRSDGSPMFSNCELNYNDEAAFEGRVGTVIFTECSIIGNNRKVINLDGGGINLFSGNIVVINSVLSQNMLAEGVGGAVSIGTVDNASFVNCLFHDNKAGGGGSGIYNSGSPNLELINCTFYNDQVANEGGLLTITNGIHWGYGEGSEGAQIGVFNGGELVINHSIVEGWTGAFGGVGNNGLDPLFVDPNGADDIPGTEDDNLRLSSGSPAIDSGDNNALPTDEFDLDADGDLLEPIPLDLDRLPRFADDAATADTGVPSAEFPKLPIVDRGAYEFRPPCEGDANADNRVDPLDAGFVLARFNCPVGGGDPLCDAADVDKDGLVDPLDVGYILARFGDCPE